VCVAGVRRDIGVSVLVQFAMTTDGGDGCIGRTRSVPLGVGVRQIAALGRSRHDPVQGVSDMSGFQRLEVTEVGDVTLVRFRDAKIVEDMAIQEVGQQLFRLVEVDNRDKMLLSFATVEFLSSAALGKLITLDKKMKAHGGTLKLSNIRPEIYEVFAITKLNRLFDIRKEEADALAAF
jgi:anti-sigma B factor antagonist